MTLQDLLDLTGGVAIQRNGSGAWFCRNGKCIAAHQIEDIQHDEDCPVKGLIKTEGR